MAVWSRQVPHEEERLLTRREVEDRFGLSVRYLEVSAVRGDGPPMIRISRRMVRYRASDIEAWLSAKRVDQTQTDRSDAQ